MSEAPILLNDFLRQWAETGAEVVRAVEAVGESGWYILGNEVVTFEQEFARASHAECAIGCANGLDALEIGLRALGLRPGQRVLTTPLSAFATTLAVMRAGGVPVYVDVDASGLLDLERAEAAFSADPDLRFFVPVHLYGHVLDLERLRELRARFELRVVEDMAQAVLGTSARTPVGSVGDFAAVSFYPTKNLGALGDAGALIGPRNDAMALARQLRDYGQSAKYVHEHIGLNSRLDELHAAILRRVFLPRLARWTARRAQIAARYRAEIAHDAVRAVPAPVASGSVWHLFPVLVSGAGRDSLAAHLRQNGVHTAVHYPSLIPHQPALRHVPQLVIGPLDRAAHFARAELSLPIHPQLTDDEVDRVIRAVNGWHG